MEGGRAHVPAAHGDHRLESWILFLEVSETLIHASRPRGGLVVPLESRQMVVLHLGEGVDEMGAQVGVDVLGHELAVAVAVLGPVSVVADATLTTGLAHRQRPSRYEQ